MKTKNFRCNQSELYAVCKLAWESCSQNIEKFNTVKVKYSPEFILERKAEITRVSEMPNAFLRKSNQGQIRIDLKEALTEVLTQFRNLKRLIAEAWPKEKAEMYLTAAGQPYYTDAYGMKWEAADQMVNSANNFIKEHKAELLLNNNMSEQFAQNFDTLTLTFSNLYSSYLEAVKKARLDTETLLDAQNKIYADLISMFNDSKTLFKKDSALQKQFVFESVLLQVSGSNMAGLKGIVSNGAIPAVEIPNILLTIKETGESTDCDEEGRYVFSPLAAGVYTLEVEAEGYKSQSIPDIEIKTSVVSKLDIHLEQL